MDKPIQSWSDKEIFEEAISSFAPLNSTRGWMIVWIAFMVLLLLVSFRMAHEWFLDGGQIEDLSSAMVASLCSAFLLTLSTLGLWLYYAVPAALVTYYRLKQYRTRMRLADEGTLQRPLALREWRNDIPIVGYVSVIVALLALSSIHYIFVQGVLSLPETGNWVSKILPFSF